MDRFLTSVEGGFINKHVERDLQTRCFSILKQNRDNIGNNYGMKYK